MSLELSLCRIQGEVVFFFVFFLMVHEIWMLFISPANPDFSGQTPSTSKHYHWQKKKKKNYRNKLGSLSCTTHKYMICWHGRKYKKVHSFLSQASQQIHYYHTQTKTHTHTHCGGESTRIPWPVSVYLKTRGSCESSQVGLLCMYMGARKTLLTAVRHFDCPARLLRPKPPNTPTSLAPTRHPHSPWPDGFFF